MASATKKKSKKPKKASNPQAESAETPDVSEDMPSGEKRESCTLSLTDIIDPPKDLIARSDEGDIDALAADIKGRGQLQSLLVRPSSSEAGKYELLSGHRRRAAMRKAGISTAHVIIARDLSDNGRALAAVYAENNSDNRCNLSAIEQARVFQTMIDSLKGSCDDPVRKAASRLRVSSEHIRRHLRIVEAPKPVLDRLERGEVSKDTVIALQQIGDASIRKVLEKRVANGDVQTSAELKRMSTELARDREASGDTVKKRTTKSGKEDKRTAGVANKGWMRKSEMDSLYQDYLTQYAAFTGQIKVDGLSKDGDAALIRSHGIALFFTIFGWIDAPDVKNTRFERKLASELKRIVSENVQSDEQDDGE